MTANLQPIAVHTPASWQQELADMIRDPAELLHLLELPKRWLPGAQAAAELFDLRVPRPFAARMEKGNINDPLLKQVLPVTEEHVLTPGYSADPLAEQDSNPQSGLIHKYHGRVLLVIAPSCAVNCRYCFRRHFPYADNNPGRHQWQTVLDTIRRDKSIREVIFSGGDPLMCGDRQLAELVNELTNIPHIKRLRVHSRLPVVIPQRITDDSLNWLTALPSVMVLHINHPNEIDEQLRQTIERLRDAGVWVLNQSVLLKGVNDCAETLARLSERLFDCGVQPYYLHLLDRVQGAAHFAVDDTDARALYQTLQTRLPGFLVPKLAREEPGAAAKTLIL
ncbi:EF-P beta-lysylation protein EpmB [Pseudomaricurvus alkylphenolicus]|uniref:EF-P beta-lysylation protein EpmB n=1 Tax=Pseudomaricurvus alkylphenolicus TaxID=1306991 RepID=UPI001423F8AA|nr:EF-P beta-lysylation protein EpmB [Pseudomaricurvus alkylphenolicus]NIB39258.1 EF-P beta-lysylation protein EpmB [Pseudomaricurvus alkylphenolicus]